jgi:hypothetical protein
MADRAETDEGWRWLLAWRVLCHARVKLTSGPSSSHLRPRQSAATLPPAQPPPGIQPHTSTTAAHVDIGEPHVISGKVENADRRAGPNWRLEAFCAGVNERRRGLHYVRVRVDGSGRKMGAVRGVQLGGIDDQSRFTRGLTKQNHFGLLNPLTCAPADSSLASNVDLPAAMFPSIAIYSVACARCGCRWVAAGISHDAFGPRFEQGETQVETQWRRWRERKIENWR